MEFLATGYTEVWISSPVVPLVQFADSVHAIPSTGINLLGVGDVPVPAALHERLSKFDSIISWYGANRPEFRQAISEMGLPCTFHAALPAGNCGVHATDFFAAQVGAPAGLLPSIRAPNVRKGNFVAIHPFSGSSRKNWPLCRYQQLAEKLQFPVRWTCGPEETLPEAIRFDDLAALSNWLAGADLFIGNDSGIAHLAAAVGTPTVALFGPTDPAVWCPRGLNVTVLCKDPFSELPVQDVLDCANRLLGSTAREVSSER